MLEGENIAFVDSGQAGEKGCVFVSGNGLVFHRPGSIWMDMYFLLGLRDAFSTDFCFCSWLFAVVFAVIIVVLVVIVVVFVVVFVAVVLVLLEV